MLLRFSLQLSQPNISAANKGGGSLVNLRSFRMQCSNRSSSVLKSPPKIQIRNQLRMRLLGSIQNKCYDRTTRAGLWVRNVVKLNTFETKESNNINDCPWRQNCMEALDSKFKVSLLLPVNVNCDCSVIRFTKHLTYCACRNRHPFELNPSDVQTNAHAAVQHINRIFSNYCAHLKLRQIKELMQPRCGIFPRKRARAIQISI